MSKEEEEEQGERKDSREQLPSSQKINRVFYFISFGKLLKNNAHTHTHYFLVIVK